MGLKGDLIIAYIVSFNLRTIIGLGNPQPKSTFSKRSKGEVPFQKSHGGLEIELGHDFFVISKFLFEFSVLINYTRVTS
jgi:hypothetical protein